ncbi:MAG: calcium-binding protein [Kofleriaceae bacterium]
MIALATGCGVQEDTIETPDPDFEGIEEGSEALTDLSSECSFVAGTGVLTVAMATGDVAMVAKTTTNAITINGFACGGATGLTLKKLVVTGTSGAQTLILDFMQGQFAPGTSAIAVGIDVDLGGGTDALKIRGSKAADAFVFGSTGIAFNADAFRDISHANVESFVVSMSDGNDTFSGAGNAATGGAAFATAVGVFGGAGDDVIRGGDGADSLDGGDGNDTFTTGAVADGNDTMVGGAGTDIADYSTRTAVLTLSIDAVANDGEGAETDNIGTDVETVKGGSNNDTITGSAGPDTIFGGAGNDTITGGLGADVLNGDAGDDTFLEGAVTSGGDTFNGGAGIDTVSYAARGVAVNVNIDGVALDGESGELDKVQVDVENLIGSTVGDVLVGSASDNVIDGGAGNDTISGGLGNDTLKGSAGNDTLNGDAGDDTFNEGTATSGNDTINGGAGDDTVDYSGRTNDLTVTLAPGTPSGESGEADVLAIDLENVLGGDGDDSITGNASDNQLEGGVGVDSLFGLAGDDVIDGNAGADIINCGTGDGDVLLDTTVASAVSCEL